MAATTRRYKPGAGQQLYQLDQTRPNCFGCNIECSCLEYQRTAGAAGIAQEAQACGDGARHIGKGYGLVCKQQRLMGQVYQLIKANRAQFPARVLCETLGVSHSGYYDWVKRTPSRRAITNCRLIEQIMAIYRTSDCTYGRPRITVELADRGVRVNHKRVGRLMREAGIKRVSRRRGFVIW